MRMNADAIFARKRREDRGGMTAKNYIARAR